MMVLLGDLVVAPLPVLARESPVGIDIAPGPIGDSLATLSRLTGISVGLAGALPRFRSPGVRGARSAAEALRRLFAGSGYRAVEVGPMAWRIELEPPRLPDASRPTSAQAPPSAAEAATEPEIIVTGQKRRQELIDVAMSLTVIPFFDRMPTGLLASSRDIALDAEGLSLTNLGPGRNRQFIRGVADSPFDGASQATVAVQLDDARVIFDAPDPDLRLVDIERIEILKGPQGPLYGSGALGGIYHIVTRKPDLGQIGGSARLIAEGVQHGGLGIGGEATLNLPLIGDRLALRAVVYDLRGAGWIDRDGGRRDTNRSDNLGGRLALRWRPSADWTVDVGAFAQHLNVADSQYVASSHSLRRAGEIAEPTDNDFHEGHATIEGRLGGIRLVSATSYIAHEVDYTLDASAAANQFSLVAPLRFRDRHRYSIFNQELRLIPASGGRWLIGASYMHARSHSAAVLIDSSGASRPVQTLDRVVAEYALFGEVTLPVAPRLGFTLGGRVYHTRTEDEAVEGQSGSNARINTTAFAPSVELSWRPRPSSIVYLRYAKALRPGGLATADQPAGGRFEPDELGTIDLGLRQDAGEGRLGIAASVYYTIWDDIQSDYLLANGLVSTRNAGRGRIIGGEASVDWRPIRRVRLVAGVNLQRARLVRTEDGVDVDDRRLPIAPDLSARLGLSYDLTVAGDWKLRLSAQANYIGPARLALDPALDRKMGGHSLASTGATVTHDRLTIAARIDNLLDAKGDSFAFGNQFSIMTGRQFTPLRPRCFTISIGRSW